MKTNPALRLKCAAFALVLLAVSGFSASAATFTVTNNNDSGPGSLRDAISAAASGDKINFAQTLNGQTITLTSGELLINKDLKIQGPGANQLTISGNHASRVFNSQASPTLSGLTITNGSTADSGGGIAHVNGILTVTKCVIVGNQATGPNSLGGGLYANASFVMSDTTVSQNSAASGGGIYSEFSFNGSWLISRSTIDHNTASVAGGGLYSAGQVLIGNITVAYNSAPLGGGVYIDGSASSPYIYQSTITGNSANSNSGGGIYGGDVVLRNSIVAFQQSGVNVVSNVNDGGGNLITDDPNLNLDPNGLQFNGGPTKTVALLAGSSAIDTGVSFGPSDPGFDGSTIKDQRGGDRPIGSGPDIGAYEYNQSACATVVTNTNDSGPGSLRCAIASAFTGDTITFAPTLGPQISLTSGELLIKKDLTIQGPGGKVLTISGSSLSRVFRVQPGKVTMSGLTIANGLTPSIVGPVVSNVGAGIAVSNLGASTSSLTLSACTVTGNQANFGTASGVGIYLGGASATITDCTISNNQVLQGAAPSSTGGGIGGNISGDVAIVNSTISGNSSYQGGGIGINNPSFGGSHFTITNSTISGNTAILSGGAVYFRSGSMVLGSTLIALNSAPTGPDIFTDPISAQNPTVNSAGYNLIGTAVDYTWINGAGDQLGIANPGLQLDANNLPLLKDNGGPTQTIALVPGSPAIDRGFADASLTTDQRGSGFARVVGAAADVGAFELQPLPVVTIPGPPTNSTATNDSTPSFYFTVSDPTAPTFCSVAGDPFVQCTSPFTSRSLPDGSYTLSVYAKDSAGNNGPTATFAFAIDHIAPIISIPVPPNVTITNSHHPSFTFTDTSAPGTAVTFQCRVDSNPGASCTSPFVPTVVIDGSHTVTVTGTDAAGNVGQASLAFVLDTVPPAVTITSGPSAGNTNPTPTFAFVTNGGATNTQCSVDTGAFVSCTSPFTTAPLAVGAHTFNVRATDAAGNVGSASSTFTVNAAVVLVSIQVTPTNPSVLAGRNQQFTATGTFSDGTNQDLTATCTWSSTDPLVASISNSLHGLATGLAAGTTTIKAVSGSVLGSTTLTVTNPLPSFTISVNPSTVKQGGAVTVTVNYSNPTSTAQTLTLKFSLTTPKSKTLMLTVPLTLKANQSGSASWPLPIAKSTAVGVYSLTLDAFLGATQVSTSSVQLTVTK